VILAVRSECGKEFKKHANQIRKHDHVDSVGSRLRQARESSRRQAESSNELTEYERDAAKKKILSIAMHFGQLAMWVNFFRTAVVCTVEDSTDQRLKNVAGEANAWV
jgi:hypothetical protein